jgi:ribosomal protein S20
MARDWHIEGRYLEYCSCDLGCPCESMADPTQGYCTGAVGFSIDKGHCDGVKLDGLKVIGTFYFPRAIHHGEGVFQPIIDERADEAQRDALFYILSGEDQAVGTMFQIFSVIIETIKSPLFAPIVFEFDLEKRREINKQVKSRMKTAIKRVQVADDGARPTALSEAMKRIDKAAKGNAIHANAAARLKSRLAKASNAKAAAK